MDQNALKKLAAIAAIDEIKQGDIVGVGTGSTADLFIDELAKIKHKIEGAVASSEKSAVRLKSHGIRVLELNSVGELPIYVDGADEFNTHKYLIKGGGGALTREKIVASSAKTFIVIADETKRVNVLGKFPVAIEVIPMARSYVARQLVKLKIDPVYRENFVTDNGQIIIDAYCHNILDPVALETTLNNLAGVICNGIFAQRRADKILIGTRQGLEII